MVVKAGDALPSTTLFEGSPENETTLQKVFSTKKGILFGVPAAWSPGCSQSHLPGYINDYDKLSAAGAEVIACVAVNDAFAVNAWGEHHGAKGKVVMLADPEGSLAKAMGVALEGDKITKIFGNSRGKRFSAVVEGGKFKTVNVEADGTGMSCSLASEALGQLK